MKIRVFLCLLTILAGCSGEREPPVEAAPEPEPIVVTQWTDKTELFLEYPPLVAGETSRFAIHLTNLKTFEPLREGRVVVTLEGGSAKQEFSADSPSRPGIFGIDVTPREAGDPRLSIHLVSGPLEDIHELGPADVHTSAADLATHEHGGEEEEAISFLKEQQWTLDFGTAVVRTRLMRESLRVPAKVEPRSGGHVAVVAPISGKLSTDVRLPIVGAIVHDGDLVASMIPPTSRPADRADLELAVREARVELNVAEIERKRAERLVNIGAIPAHRLEHAKADEEVARAKLRAAEARIEQHERSRRGGQAGEETENFDVRSPLTGVVTAVGTTDGAYLEQGNRLLEVVAIDHAYVVGEVPEIHAYAMRRPRSAEVVVPGVERTLPVTRLISVSRFVDEQTRTLKVVYEVDNRRGALAIGQALYLRLFTEQTSDAPAIPESALVDDGGQPVVFVQTGGESFARRSVQLGNRSGDEIQVLSGVEAGERVVTKGAHLIRLAALSTQVPAHGHVH